MTATAPAMPWRRILMPSEHGSWAFLAEPILLGLLVRWSGAGALLALAAVAAFFARQPLRLLVGDRRRGRRYPRTRQAERAFALLALAGAAALAGGCLLGRGRPLFVLGLAAPVAAAALAFDLSPRSREAAAETLAPAALAAVAAAIAVAGGAGLGLALGLWAVLVARAVPAVLYVRARLRLDRGEPAGIDAPLLAHVAALLAMAVLAAQGRVPRLAAVALGVLVVRAAWGLSPSRPRWRTAWLGASEIGFGLLTVALTRIGLG